jgi:hypothetical protein
MGFLCRLTFQAILFLFLPAVSFGQYNLSVVYPQLYGNANDTIFLTDHYVYGLGGDFNYILSGQEEEAGRVIKMDTIVKQRKSKPETRKKNRKEQISEQRADDPVSPCALLYFNRRNKVLIKCVLVSSSDSRECVSA